MPGWREDYEVNGPGVNPHDYQYEDDFMDSLRNNQRRMEEEERRRNNNSGGCYIATCVYRDERLQKSAAGRAFIKTYYFISPKLVKTFGNAGWFRKFWRKRLDRMVGNLQEKGFRDTPYED